VKAAVLHGQNDIIYEDIQKPEIGKDEVLINVKATGICGSDIPRVLGKGAHYYPIVLGHEFAGVVADVGENVDNVQIGARVTAAPLVPCHNCIDCQTGHFSQCNYYKFIGSSLFGSWAEYVKVPAINVVKLPDEVSFEEGAFFEPSTVVLHAIFNSDFRSGYSAAVLGCGTIGQLTIQWLRIMGASHIYVFDIDNEKLEIAKKLGAEDCFNTLDKGFEEKFQDIVKNRGVDYVFETAGVVFTQKLSLKIVTKKGTICFVGTATNNLVLEPSLFELILRKEVTLKGSWMSYSAPFPGHEWWLTAEAFRKKDLKVENMIYKKFSLSDINEAFNLFKTHVPIKGKVMLFNE
jgi:L-iditol 2-dehydrogenase